MLAFDLHLDLAMNALWYDRDLKLDLAEARRSEAATAGEARSGGAAAPPAKARGKGTVTLPEMRRGHVGLCVATVLARVRRGEGGFGSGYRTHEITYGLTQGMLAYYRELERQGEMRMVRTGTEMRRAADEWETAIGGGISD